MIHRTRDYFDALDRQPAWALEIGIYIGCAVLAIGATLALVALWM